MKKLITLTMALSCLTELHAQDIHNTVCEGNMERLEAMLDTTEIQVVDRRGRSLLHWAVACKQMDILRYLVDQGIDINNEDNAGDPPIYVAVLFNRDEYLDTLIARQKDNTWVTNYGTMLLQKAILNRNLRSTQRILAEGVGINSLNERGSSPLEIAQRSGAEEVADWLIAAGADKSLVRKFELKGAYMGQEDPGLTAQVFAPNFISTEEFEYGSVFNKAGTEFYYGVSTSRNSETRFTQLVDGIWTPPVTILSHEKYGYNDPFLSNDEQRLYFISKQPMDGEGEPKDHDIWYVERQPDGWSEPVNAGSNINTAGNEYYISFTQDGTMYFSSNGQDTTKTENPDHDIYYSKAIDGVFQPAVNLGDSINTEHYEGDVFVAPDESYLVFCATRPEGMGRGDLYVSFRKEDGSWTQGKNMGEGVNTDGHELCPYVTPDGKYLFYTRNREIYWISAEVIANMRSD